MIEEGRGMIKAIETNYNGYRFRSRLEARWAVFFDTLGIEYYYEPEGFDLGDGIWYLPDFWLPQVKKWAEVKPAPLSADELEKCKRLVKYLGYDCLLLIGIPDNKPYDAVCYNEPPLLWPGIDSEEPGLYLTDYCLTAMYLDENRFFACPGEFGQFDDVGRAAIAAKRARFERDVNLRDIPVEKLREAVELMDAAIERNMKALKEMGKELERQQMAKGTRWTS
jgi:hypothetical protein